jgi:membrane associated rhomboid family serine protease
VTTSISPFGTVGRAFRRLPVTTLVILVACFLHSLTIYLYFFGESPSERTSKPGSLDILMLTEFPDIHGMISLWEGEWWRLTVGAFYHVNLLHLLMNVLSLWIFADLLEPKLGKWRYLTFCLLAATFSIGPEAINDRCAVGLSGMIYALFGLLLVVRRHDESIAERIHPYLVPWCFVWLFLCIPLDISGMMPIANGGHLIGIVYGATVGWVCYDLRLRSRLASYSGLAAVHFGLIVGVLALIQPVWNGRYVAWQAIQQPESIESWQKAVELDPSLETGWRFLAEHYVTSGDRHKAWVTVLEGARLNRSSTKLDELARYVWQEFDSADDRAVAKDELQRVFGDEHEAWIERFELPLSPAPSSTTLVELAFPDLPPVSTVKLDTLLDVPAEVSGITRPLPAIYPPGTINPDHPESASLGTTL